MDRYEEELQRVLASTYTHWNRENKTSRFGACAYLAFRAAEDLCSGLYFHNEPSSFALAANDLDRLEAFAQMARHEYMKELANLNNRPDVYNRLKEQEKSEWDVIHEALCRIACDHPCWSFKVYTCEGSLLQDKQRKVMSFMVDGLPLSMRKRMIGYKPAPGDPGYEEEKKDET